MQKYGRVVAIGFAIIWLSMVTDFLLLVSTMQFHWFQPFWSVTTGRIMLIGLIGVSLAECILPIFQLVGVAYFVRNGGWNEMLVIRLIANASAFPALAQSAVWGYEALAGHPSAWPLILLAWVIAAYALALCVWVRIRHTSKVRFRLSSGSRPISGK